MQFFVEILSRTPFWVWIVLAALLALGLSSTRTSARSYMGLMAPAIVFATIALAKLAYARFDGLALIGTLGGGVVALALIVLIKPARFTERRADGLYLIRGEWLSLAIILAVFAVNYVSSVLAAAAPDIAATPGVVLTTALTNGFSAFFMAGRTVAHLRAGDAPEPAAAPSLEV